MTTLAYNAIAAGVKPGDFIDAEGIPYFSDEDRDFGQYELFEVESVEHETPDCIAIYCNNGSAAMPPSTPVFRITFEDLRAENNAPAFQREEN